MARKSNKSNGTAERSEMVCRFFKFHCPKVSLLIFWFTAAFQTAVALAEYEAEKDEEGKILLKDDHLKSIVEMSRDFKNYLDKLHRGDEGKRAEREYSRLAEDGEQFSRDEYGN